MNYITIDGKKIKNMSGQDRFLRFVYGHAMTRLFLKPFLRPGFSKLGGKILSSKLSKCLIPHFIKKNGIDMNEYEAEEYKNFNEFFCRRIKITNRPINYNADTVISPADGALTVYEITDNAQFKIKNTVYSVRSLTRSKALTERFRGGTCVIIRLQVNNYHRYHFIDDGELVKKRFIPGVLHTVNPIANDHYKIYKENSREISLYKMDHFGSVLTVEVGALMVGKIVNEEKKEFLKGDEKGHFEFGGSTIVLLFERDKVQIDPKFFKGTQEGFETEIKMGMAIGKSIQG